MKLNRMTLAATAIVAALFLMTMGAPIASADVFTSTIDTGNTALAGLASPFGTVTITVTGGVATVEFKADNSYDFGDSSSVDLNLSQSGITASGFTWTGGDASTAFTNAGSGTVDGFGVFNLTVNDFDGATSSVSDVKFTLSGTWGSAASVLTANAGGWDAAAHIFANGGAITGFAAESAGTPTVPDGGMTLMLLGGVLVSIESLRRKFRA